MTIDGKIATKDHDSKISSSKDIRTVHALRAKVDAIMVGVNTVLVDDPLLTNRSGVGKHPLRVVVDSRARTPLSSRLVTDLDDTGDRRTLIACSKRASAKRIKKLNDLGADVVTFGSDSQVDLGQLLRYLRSALGVKFLLVEGGSELNWSFISKGLLDEIRLTMSPQVFGGRDAISLVSGEGVAKSCESFRFKLVSIRRENTTGEVRLCYRVN